MANFELESWETVAECGRLTAEILLALWAKSMLPYGATWSGRNSADVVGCCASVLTALLHVMLDAAQLGDISFTEVK